MSLFIPLRKVDAAQRLVWGRIDETPDRAGEIFDYASSKPHFAAWSAEMQKASGGRSLGNLRAMHGPSAAGRLEDIAFDDQAKSVELVGRVIDDDAWKKVEAGVYTGFSPGGRYVKRWPDGEHFRYTAKPAEISLVDLPCIPSATFTLVKADGLSEERPFAKIGARNSKADLARIQAVHDTAVELGASCHEPDFTTDLDPAKAVPAGRLRKIMGELGRAREDLVKMAEERDRLRQRVAELEARPRPGGPALRAIEKGQDIGGGAPSAEDELAKIAAMPEGLEKSLALIKLAHRKPVVVNW